MDFANSALQIGRTAIISAARFLCTALALVLAPYVSAAMAQTLSALPGKAIGVVVANPERILAREGRTAPKGAVAFSINGETYRWLFLKAVEGEEGTTEELPIGRADKKKSFKGVILATREALKRRRIGVPYALVEVEVNGGRGAPAGADRFVATRLERIDRGGAKVGSVTGLVSEILDDCANFAKGDRKLRDAYKMLSAKHAKSSRKMAYKSELVPGVTWLESDKMVQVICTIQKRGAEMSADAGMVPSSGAAAGAGIPYGHRFQVSRALTYRGDLRGKFKRIEVSKLSILEEEVPPPGGTMPGGMAPKGGAGGGGAE